MTVLKTLIIHSICPKLAIINWIKSKTGAKFESRTQKPQADTLTDEAAMWGNKNDMDKKYEVGLYTLLLSEGFMTYHRGMLFFKNSQISKMDS